MTGQHRFHLTLAAAGRVLMHGWWPDRVTADRKYLSWIGERGSIDGARITLVDEETGTVLTTWPAER